MLDEALKFLLLGFLLEIRIPHPAALPTVLMLSAIVFHLSIRFDVPVSLESITSDNLLPVPSYYPFNQVFCFLTTLVRNELLGINTSSSSVSIVTYRRSISKTFPFAPATSTSSPSSKGL